jgi:hypothetical protein
MLFVAIAADFAAVSLLGLSTTLVP